MIRYMFGFHSTLCMHAYASVYVYMYGYSQHAYVHVQEMDLMLVGDVLGFDGGPAGYRHSVIMRRNITICGTDEFVAGTCTPGTPALRCFDA